jgi:hypothetical protein
LLARVSDVWDQELVSGDFARHLVDELLGGHLYELAEQPVCATRKERNEIERLVSAEFAQSVHRCQRQRSWLPL